MSYKQETMTRPIFIIRLNKDIDRESRTSIFANMKLEMPDIFEEYHIIYASGENKHIEFECYNPYDIPADVRDNTLALITDIITNQS